MRAPKWKLREIERVTADLGDKVICDRCGCNLDTFADKCSAPLDEPCPGFMAIDEAKKRAHQFADSRPR